MKCYKLKETQTPQGFTFDITKKTPHIMIYPSEPSYIYCSVEQYTKRGVYVGMVSSITHFVSFSMKSSIDNDYLPSPVDHIFTGQAMIATITFDQLLSDCTKEMFEVSSMTIVHIRMERNSFTTACVLQLESDMGGYKQIKLSKYVTESIAGSTNTEELVLNFAYEKSRPLLTLYDITPFSDTYHKERKVIVVFSRAVSDLSVILNGSYYV